MIDRWRYLSNIQHALLHGKDYLSSEPEDALRAAEILLQHTLDVSRAYLYAHGEQSLSQEQSACYQALLEQRQRGVPIAYILGKRSFWTFDLTVTQDTLIPRPETELLVDCVLQEADSSPQKVLDLGTGSGAIALALATERPNWHITASDISPAALSVAQHNAAMLKLNQIHFVHSDWLQAFEQQQFDIIVANPPYLCQDDPHLQQGDLRFEPQSALISGKEGLDALRIIIQQCCHHLRNHGLLIMEHGYDQRAAVNHLLTTHGYQDIQSWQDWQGHDRISCGRRLLV